MSEPHRRTRGPGAPAPRPPVRRVQRPTATLPVLHLETEIPARTDWALGIRGLVRSPLAWTIEELRDLAREEREWDLHCVWGWSRPACRWRGVPAAWLLEQTGPRPEAAYALVTAAGRTYASCLSIQEVRESLIALDLDDRPLPHEHGGPIRFVPPPNKWGYKGVKWATEIALVATFTPGVWESLVGNPHGDVPTEMLDLRFEE